MLRFASAPLSPRLAAKCDPKDDHLTRMRTILSGGPEIAPLLCSPPFLIASICSIPSVTWPQTEYCRSSQGELSKQMKNWLFALFGLAERAIEHVPRTCFSPENSALRSPRSDPPVPVPVGSPVCAMNPGITRWNTTP